MTEKQLISRRSLLTVLTGTAAVAAASSYTLAYAWAKPSSAASWENPGDMAVGNPEAPIVVIEYFSLTCPHCMRFHKETYAAFRRQYVETGKVRYILRDYPLNAPALDAAKLAHCGGPERYFPFVETLFERFEQWTRGDHVAALAKIGEFGGISEAAFKVCLNDKDLEARILAVALEGETKYNIKSTPSFVVNGKLHTGEMRIEKFSKILDALLPES